MKSLPARLEAIRNDPAINPASLTEYLKMTQEGLRACVSEFQRRSGTLVLLIVVCELLLRSLVAELSFAGLKVSDLSLIQKALPLAIAYAYYALLSVVVYRRLLEEVHDTVFGMVMPVLHKQNLEWFAHPPTPFHIDKIFEGALDGLTGKAFAVMRVPFLATIMFGPPAYIIYVLVKYFSVYGWKDYYLWISAIGACAFVLQGLLTARAIGRWIPDE